MILAILIAQTGFIMPQQAQENEILDGGEKSYYLGYEENSQNEATSIKQLVSG